MYPETSKQSVQGNQDCRSWREEELMSNYDLDLVQGQRNGHDDGVDAFVAKECFFLQSGNHYSVYCAQSAAVVRSGLCCYCSCCV